MCLLNFIQEAHEDEESIGSGLCTKHEKTKFVTSPKRQKTGDTTHQIHGHGKNIGQVMPFAQNISLLLYRRIGQRNDFH